LPQIQFLIVEFIKKYCYYHEDVCVYAERKRLKQYARHESEKKATRRREREAKCEMWVNKLFLLKKNFFLSLTDEERVQGA
jgi:hypothetical protein